MTRYDQWNWVAAERLADLACQAAVAQTGRDLAVGEGRAGADVPRDFVDLLLKRIHAREIERDGGKVTRLPAQQRDDAIDRPRNVLWWRHLVRIREPHQQTGAGLFRLRLRQLHRDNAVVAPGNATGPDRRIEQCVTVGHDGRDDSAPGATVHPVPCDRYSGIGPDSMAQAAGQHTATALAS